MTLATLALAMMTATSPTLTQDERMDWWRDARFGMFIHWGLYAVPAGEWKGKTNYGEWIMTSAQIPVEQYEKFVPQFNPVKFDAEAWAKMAKDAGMKYIVITTKHHDGFALFDSKVSDYDIMATPYKRDIMKELSDACRKYGLKMGWYHSIMDWHHPDYLPRRGWEDRSAEGADFDRYVDYMKGQVKELLTNYGDIGVMWFDGEWEATWNTRYGSDLYKFCRDLQPNVIVNNRVTTGRSGMGDAGNNKVGDFGTPEQHIPAEGLPGVDWETCMTMGRHWGYNSRDTYKTPETLVQNLIDIASKGGNYLLNVGPRADGTFPPESVNILKEFNRWMSVNGEAIYETTASPMGAPEWGRITTKQTETGHDLYLHIFDWPSDGRLVVPGLGNDGVKATLLATGKPAKVQRQVSDLVVTVPSEPLSDYASVIKLHLDQAPIVYTAPTVEVAAEIFVKSAQVKFGVSSPELEVRYTLDGSDPDSSSTLYDGKLEVEESSTIKARAFHEGRAVSPVASVELKKVQPNPATKEGKFDGLKLTEYSGDWDELPDFSKLVPDAVKKVKKIGLGRENFPEYAGVVLTGTITAPADDVYLFDLLSDDGSKLWIDGNVVVDHDGLHAPTVKRGVIALAKGAHRIRIEMFNKAGGSALGLAWARDRQKR